MAALKQLAMKRSPPPEIHCPHRAGIFRLCWFHPVSASFIHRRNFDVALGSLGLL